MFYLNKYKEKIDTELPNSDSILPIQAIKTDASSNSLKAKLELNCIKTCDYLRFKGNSTLTLIECSDLDRQKSQLEKDLNDLIVKSLELGDKELKKAAIKANKNHRTAVEKIIFDELKTKYKDSLLLVNKIADMSNLNFTQRFNKKEFIIVTNKFEASTSVDSIALDEFRRSLTRDLKSGLSCIVDDVRVLTPQKLLESFKNIH